MRARVCSYSKSYQFTTNYLGDTPLARFADERPHGVEELASYLSTALGVSRPTVREALNQVAQEGLLVQEPYRGLRVADLDPATVLDIADVRVALDMQAVSAVLADSTGRRMQRLMAAWSTYERNAFASDPLIQHEAHIAFHRGIWAASENTFLMRMWPVKSSHHDRVGTRSGHPARPAARACCARGDHRRHPDQRYGVYPGRFRGAYRRQCPGTGGDHDRRR